MKRAPESGAFQRFNLAQKLAQARTFEAYGLHKLARTRFLELADKGLLSEADKARLGITQRFTDATGKMKNRMVRSLRGKLYGAATDLTPAQLGRHRKLNAKLQNAITARHGNQISDASFLGPVSLLGGNLMVARDMREQLHKQTPMAKRNARAMASVHRGMLNHELAENAMTAGAAHWARQQGAHAAAAVLAPQTPEEMNSLLDSLSHQMSEINHPESGGLRDRLAKTVTLIPPGTTHAYEAKPFASHLGPAAVIADNQSLFRDPAAADYLDHFRQKELSDDYVRQKMKQFGHTPGYPMPLGGKQHFALDEAVANIPENLIGPSAVALRMATPGSKLPEGIKERAQAHLQQIAALEQAGHIPAQQAETMRQRAQTVADRAARQGTARMTPYTDPQEARRRFMAQFAAVRNDANPGTRI